MFGGGNNIGEKKVMNVLGMLTSARVIFLMAMLVSNAFGKGMSIQLNGYLDDSVTDCTIRSEFKIVATHGEILASLHRKVLGTIHPEAVDVNVEFKITDDNFVDEWRRQALAAFLESSVRQKNTVETRLPNGYWIIYVDAVPPPSYDDSANHAHINDASMQLVTTTLSALNQMIERKEYQQISLARSEGDSVPAIPLSFGELLEYPQKWDGKRVRLVGWFSHGEEKSVVYPSRFYAWMGKNGIWVGNRSTIATGIEYPAKYEGRHEIEGVVRASMHGHLGGFCCTIDRLTINRLYKGTGDQAK
jgi:hypothetical protein